MTGIGELRDSENSDNFAQEAQQTQEARDALLMRALQQALDSQEAADQAAEGREADLELVPEHEVRVRWAELAQRLGMNPDLSYYHEDHENHENHKNHENHPEELRSKRRRMPLWRATMWAAAVLVPAVLGVSALFFSSEHRGSDAAPVATTVATSAPETFESTSKTAPVLDDDIQQITLPDGTRVTLNRRAKLSYNGNREVELSGEAYFSVAKDADHPFVIYTNDLKVTVRGTEFNLNTHTTTLSLYEGHVDLEYAAGRQSLRSAGREFVLDHATGEPQVSDFDTAQTPQWMDETTRIMSLGEILDQIERRYGVEVAGRGAVDESRQLRFSVGGELNGVMSRLEYLSEGDFSYTAAGTTITLTKN